MSRTSAKCRYINANDSSWEPLNSEYLCQRCPSSISEARLHCLQMPGSESKHWNGSCPTFCLDSGSPSCAPNLHIGPSSPICFLLLWTGGSVLSSDAFNLRVRRCAISDRGRGRVYYVGLLRYDFRNSSTNRAALLPRRTPCVAPYTELWCAGFHCGHR